MTISEGLQKLKDKALLVLGGIAAILFVLFKRSQSQLAEEKAKQVAAEEKGKAHELKTQTGEAEKVASDSRSDYIKLTEQYRKK